MWKWLTLLVLISLSTSPLTAQGKFVPSQIKLGVDLAEPIYSALNKDKIQFEMNGDIDFHRYFMSADVGFASYSRNRNNYKYSSSGTYFRIGPDINFLASDPDQHVIFAGIRYGAAFYNDKATYIVENPVYGDFSGEGENQSITANWFEITTGMKVRVWNKFFLGYTVHFRLGLSLSGLEGQLNSFDVPGYGPADDGGVWGFNYHIFYQIPWRKKKIEEAEGEIEN